MNGDQVIDEWRRVGEDPEVRSLAIHPSGADEKDYRATGRQAAVDLVRTIGEHHRREPGVVMDYGCGDGRVTHELARLEPYWQVVGVDASPAMVDAFAERGRRIGSSAEAMVWHTGLGGCPYDDVSVVYALAVFIHHDHDTGAAMLAGLVDAVEPGGLVLVDVPLYAEPRVRTGAFDVTTWTAAMFTDAVAAAGGDVVEVYENPGVFDWSTGPGPFHGRPQIVRRALA